MTIRELVDKDLFEVVCEGTNMEREITEPYCCDLLSFAMSKAPEGGAWVTVMGNINTLAVATLTEVGCIILAEGAVLDDMAAKKAVQEEMTVLRTEEPIFKTALEIYNLLEAEK